MKKTALLLCGVLAFAGAAFASQASTAPAKADTKSTATAKPATAKTHVVEAEVVSADVAASTLTIKGEPDNKTVKVEACRGRAPEVPEGRREGEADLQGQREGRARGHHPHHRGEGRDDDGSDQEVVPGGPGERGTASLTKGAGGHRRPSLFRGGAPSLFRRAVAAGALG